MAKDPRERGLPCSSQGAAWRPLKITEQSFSDELAWLLSVLRRQGGSQTNRHRAGRACDLEMILTAKTQLSNSLKGDLICHGARMPYRESDYVRGLSSCRSWGIPGSRGQICLGIWAELSHSVLGGQSLPPRPTPVTDCCLKGSGDNHSMGLLGATLGKQLGTGIYLL